MTLRVNVYLRQVRAGGISPHVIAAANGFRRHGIEVTFLKPGNPQPCDLAVCWGVKKKAEMASGRRALILERGYVGDRGYWTSCGFDDLNGRADFCNAGSPPDRWQRFFSDQMRPWRQRSGGYVLLVGQVRGDASISNVNLDAWCRRVATKLIAAGEQVRFRDHPLQRIAMEVPGATRSSEFLEHDLAGAKYVVTYNSNVGVDAVLAGVPVVTCDPGAMAWPVTDHDPFAMPKTHCRERWAHDLAYAQWSPEEIEEGTMWDHLKAGMERCADVA